MCLALRGGAPYLSSSGPARLSTLSQDQIAVSQPQTVFFFVTFPSFEDISNVSDLTYLWVETSVFYLLKVGR